MIIFVWHVPATLGDGGFDVSNLNRSQLTAIWYAVAFSALAVFPFVLLYIFDQYRRRLDRKRVAEQLAQHGWTLTDLRRNPTFFGSSNQPGRRYRATYSTPDGGQIQADCVTSLLMGVRWESSTPPGPA